jgi:CubicO group peptidase (beta-lactamase class C family)
MLRVLVCFSFICFALGSKGQGTTEFADSIRRAFHMPELSFAVVSSGSVIEMQALGVRKINTNLAATFNDRFRIGSNTKAITGYIAAMLVKEGKISWDTRFFDLYPELKTCSRKEYYGLTLLDLLSFRNRLPKYTYTNSKPVKGQFGTDPDSQQYFFTKWILHQAPQPRSNTLSYSNPGYVSAALMLGKVSGKSYKQLVADFGKETSIDFGFGRPSQTDSLQTWGHNATLKPEQPGDDYKLDWLQAAGNINVTLSGYIKFIQLQLKGLNGQPCLLSKDETTFLHYGLPSFAVGWFWEKDEQNRVFSNNIGNPGTFLSRVYVYGGSDKAFILFTNVQSDAAEHGLDLVYEALKQKYLK